MQSIRRALLSVYDKTGIVDFARMLVEQGIEIISTGGTYSVLGKAGLPVTAVRDVTNFPEMLDGRVKTLHPHIHAGLLARRDLDAHMRQIEEHNIACIDLVVINLYPFEETVAAGATAIECIEQIDIGGPSMLRSAAKNHDAVTVVCDPADYDAVAGSIRERGNTTKELRRVLAAKVFARTAAYDHAIARWMAEDAGGGIPDRLLVSADVAQPLRYGENPHQPAALYGRFFDDVEKLHGKELSFNNIVDLDAAIALIEEFDRPAAAIIKHTNPCGCAVSDTLFDAYTSALTTDPLSAYGGIVAFNREVDVRLAEKLNEMFSELIVAPAFADDAMDILRRKRDRRLLRFRPRAGKHATVQMKSVRNGYLCQMSDSGADVATDWRVVTTRQPTDAERGALAFAWTVVKHVKSNAIVYTDTHRTLGIGAGQMSRVDASTIAVWKATQSKLSLHGSVVASDAYFPFADGLLEAVKAGATAVIQPGGSVRDEEVIAAANEHGIAMIMTGIRHFKH
ncbi:MAG: bifunctional phosphoribosylaminoimidazolecarboxamide formyltransferase/IMP cyclohydrolase [Bacteroidota bacterium]|jgi:phosphoribosylaminoimidazolecarboxamide formyltransferase/IMP cyclohydrolase|nr:bifunctional phosphoribosylaminoimidazolecarboxamide formyltransferase/IMP cyclohydrolase [Bacteroidota bacterium]